nr:DnaB helicase C-terminal domain-containing protein [Thermosporothrix hazakensis]
MANPSDVWGWSWGFVKLDKLTGGIQWEGTSELTVLGARPSIGKSSFMLSVVLSVARQYAREYPGLEVRVILLEMTPMQVQLRAASALSGVNVIKMRRGQLTFEEKRRVDAAFAHLASLPIKWLKGKHDVSTISKYVRTPSEQSGRSCGFWALDHIGIVPTPDAMRTGNTTFSLGNLSGQLHSLAREVAPGLVLAQLNRQSTQRKDPTPTASDLYGADKILQDCDNLLLLHRPEKYIERAPDEVPERELAYVLVAKQREGFDGVKIPVLYINSFGGWADLSEEEAELMGV